MQMLHCNVQIREKQTKRRLISGKKNLFPTFFQNFFLLLLSLLMSSPTGYSVCSLCKKRCEALRKIPTEYDGPIFPPSGRLQLQKCCRNCLDFCRAWIQVGFS